MQAGLLKFKNGMTTVLNWTLIVAVLLLVFSVGWGVISRSIGELVVWLSQTTEWTPWKWLPTGQSKWTEELARFLLVWVSLLGGAVAFGTKGHLGVDFFVGKFHAETQKLMSIVVHSVVLFFAVSIFIYGGGRMVSDALAMEQMTPALNWKMGHVYLALPISGIFMVIYTIENLIETMTASAEGEVE